MSTSGIASITVIIVVLIIAGGLLFYYLTSEGILTFG